MKYYCRFLIPLIKVVPRLVDNDILNQQIDDQWRSLPIALAKCPNEDIINLPVDKCWQVQFLYNIMYNFLYVIICMICCITHIICLAIIVVFEVSLDVMYLYYFFFCRWEIQKYSNTFIELCTFALDVLCLPHENADCERVFSAVNWVKTKFRNRLVTDTISGILHTKQLIKTTSNDNCIKFEPTKEMFNKMKHSMLFPKKLNDEETKTVFNLFSSLN